MVGRITLNSQVDRNKVCEGEPMSEPTNVENNVENQQSLVRTNGVSETHRKPEAAHQAPPIAITFGWTGPLT